MSCEKLQERMFLNTLHDLFNQIGKPSDNPAQLYSKVAKTCAELVDAESCSIWIWDRGKDKLYLRGAHGYSNPPTEEIMANNLDEKWSYSRGNGVTWTVFESGVPRTLTSKEELKTDKFKDHIGTKYKALWGDDKDREACDSFYQFPLGDIPIIVGERRIGVMKVENKLDNDRKPVKNGGFPEDDEKILQLLANSAVPTIYLLTELQALNERARSKGPSANLQYTSNIDSIFSQNVLDAISKLKSPKDRDLNEHIKRFIERVERERGNFRCEYLRLTEQHIEEITQYLFSKVELTEYLKPLRDYQAILFQIPGYREHFIHQFNVFLIGYLILNKISPKLFNLFKNCINVHAVRKNQVPPKHVFQAWFLASMLHDTGYPLGEAGTWAKSLMGKMFDLKEQIGRAPLNVTEPLAARLVMNGAFDWLRFLTDKIRHEFQLTEEKSQVLNQKVLYHFVGYLADDIVAALLLIRAGKHTGLEDAIIAASATAISAHDENLWEILEKVHFQIHPLAFLLFYCDSAQEHGRQRSDDPEKKEWRVSATQINITSNAVESVLTYSKIPENWLKKVWPKIQQGRNYFFGPPGLEFRISYKFPDSTKDEILIFRDAQPS